QKQTRPTPPLFLKSALSVLFYFLSYAAFRLLFYSFKPSGSDDPRAHAETTVVYHRKTIWQTKRKNMYRIFYSGG
ncbi:MAG: hypothetical protein KBA88_05900, partial [Clostridia bacterium]|nr:hypothetical protein [Clostridia bacterium]